MPIFEVIGFYFDELLGVLEWSRRTKQQRLQTLAAWALVLGLIAAGVWLFGSSDVE